MSNYLNYEDREESDEQYIYILSRKEQRDILKIGMTVRNVEQRVSEINASTGVLFPLSARKVYKVKNAKLAEKLIHNAMDEYRIRKDREFFQVSYSIACRIIEDCLKKADLFYYK